MVQWRITPVAASFCEQKKNPALSTLVVALISTAHHTSDDVRHVRIPRRAHRERQLYWKRRGIDDLSWKRVGREDWVVTQDAATAYDMALTAAADTAAGVGGESSELEPAALTVVARIAMSNFWPTPCGYWKGPMQFTPTFADLKLNCLLEAPPAQPFANDFKNVLKDVATLMARVETPGNTKQGIFDPTGSSIKVRHVVFERKAAGDDDDEGLARKSDAAQKACDSMAATHRINPIAAYDVDSNLIPPTQYGTLAGATVRACISLVHWNIGSDRKDTYVADIVSLRVITPGPGPSATNASSPIRKRKISAKDSGASPSKRARGA
ncbi:hypothetical protein B0H10DRAFT_2217979 [Mycena sp. CBHHK59/15]|nr:hypothetical protein B0H10DRAFT_2217979 [Mycena sp. CBHHK59/15]